MHAFDVLGDPVRRRILELLAGGERAAGDVAAVIQREFAISQAAVSQHLKVLRDNDFATVRADGARRIYEVDAAPLKDIDVWLNRFRGFWEPKLDALATEIARGKKSATGLNHSSAGGACRRNPAAKRPRKERPPSRRRGAMARVQ